MVKVYCQNKFRATYVDAISLWTPFTKKTHFISLQYYLGTSNLCHIFFASINVRSIRKY